MPSISVNDDTFEQEVLKSDLPVLVDFWAPWCGPCKAIGPLIEELSDEMDGKIKVVKVNIEDAPNTPTKYGVRGIPTLMIFKDGALSDTKVGGMPKSKLLEWAQGAI